MPDDSAIADTDAMARHISQELLARGRIYQQCDGPRRYGN